MNIEIEIQKCKSYTDPINCGIAKGLRKKGILALVGGHFYLGLFLGIIPIFGKISVEANNIAQKSDTKDFIPTKAKISLFN